jgi:hypothetical protein
MKPRRWPKPALLTSRSTPALIRSPFAAGEVRLEDLDADSVATAQFVGRGREPVAVTRDEDEGETVCGEAPGEGGAYPRGGAGDQSGGHDGQTTGRSPSKASYPGRGR